MFIPASHGELFFGNLMKLQLVCSGAIEIHPGPKAKTQILFCHWNLNCLAAHNFIKVCLLQALSVTHDYDIICLWETFLDSSISNEDKTTNIKGLSPTGGLSRSKSRLFGLHVFFAFFRK